MATLLGLTRRAYCTTKSSHNASTPTRFRSIPPSPSWLTGGRGIMAGWNAPSKSGPGGALYSIDQVTGAENKVYSFESQSARDPNWTVDGNKLYHHRVSAPVITVMDTSGVVSEIFRDTPATGIRDVTPSPDGKTLAYISMSGMENHAIKLLDLATGTAKELVGNIRPSYLRRCLAWTPDGRTIIYSTESRPLSKLWIVSTEGGQPRQLGPDFDGRLFELTVSPDGRQLGFDWSRTSIELWRKEVFPR